ncbi:hypothetical protein HK405_014498 [Cladochytrium tenue]|nr:hypothetical protein HK405_014498 [Cladochytrium tenue]
MDDHLRARSPGRDRRGELTILSTAAFAAAAVVTIATTATPTVAVPTDWGAQAIHDSLTMPLTWQSTILGIIGIGAGLLIGLEGYLKKKYILFTFGFIDAAMVAAIIAWNAEPADGYNTRGALYPVVLGVSGLVGGLLCLFLPDYIALFANTGCGAFALALWLNTLRSGCLLGSSAGSVGRGLFFALVPVGAGLLSWYADKRFLMPAAAAAAGVLLTAVGVDSFLRSGYAFAMVASVTAGDVGGQLEDLYEFNTSTTVLAGLAAGFALISLVYHLIRERNDKKKAAKK